MTEQPLEYNLSTTDKSTRVQDIYTEQVTKQNYLIDMCTEFSNDVN